MFSLKQVASASVLLSVATAARQTVTRSFATTTSDMAQTEHSAPLFVEPSKPHTASVILIHGLGDSAYGWIDVAEQFSQSLPHVRFVLPTATEKPVTLNGGMLMPSWYDIRGLSHRSKEDCVGLEGSTTFIHELIEKEAAKGIPHSRIVVSGFSQGGAMSLWVGLQHEKKLAGVVSMSGYLPRPETFKPSPANLETPVLFCHGTSDDVVRLEWARLSESRIKEMGVKNVAFKEYERMGHTAIMTEIRDVLGFLRSVIPPQ